MDDVLPRDPRLERFVDPRTTRAWAAFQRVQLDNLRIRIITMRDGSDADTSGICQLCGRPFDDHRLTWANDFYNRRICPKVAAPVVPVPAEYHEVENDF